MYSNIPGSYLLSSSDTSAKDAGTDLSNDPYLKITDDITGTTRIVPWDVGASEASADVTAPVDNIANLQFTDTSDPDGMDVAVTWTAFTDNVGVVNHRIKTYTDVGCTANEIDHGLTGSGTNSDSAIVDGLTTGTYRATVTAYDAAGNSTTSACSTDSISVP